MSESKVKESRREARKGMSFFPNPWKRMGKRDRKRALKVMAAPVEEIAPATAKRPLNRGWSGRGEGEATYVQAPPLWRGTTVQVCGLWPFAIGTGTPMVGVPLGRHIHTDATLCCDPISWFQRAKLISNPSVFVLGKPGLGKSTVIRRMATGLAAFGVMPMVLGDLKPDYVDLIEKLGGQVIALGRGRGYLNVLDPGEAIEAVARLREAAGEVRSGARIVPRAERVDDVAPEAWAERWAAKLDRMADEVEGDSHSRRLDMVASLITILRKQPPSDVEESLISAALRVLDARFTDQQPVLPDLLAVVQEGPDELRDVAVDRGDFSEYQRITAALERSLISLVRGGRLGETFSRPTTQPMRRDRPVVYDVSGLGENEPDLRAASLLACWSNGFATVNIAHVLADAGLEPRRHYFVIMDELWQALRAGSGIVDRVDRITRLNRTIGIGIAMITHTMSDLLALPTVEDQMKARGFVERSGMVICGGLPQAEMPALTQAIPFSRAEQELLIGWQDPPSWDPHRGANTDPPGLGHFLVKVGGSPGIPVKVELTQTELTGQVNDTNKRWRETSRVGRRGTLHAVDEEMSA